MYLTTGEAAKKCGVKLNTIKNWIRNGDITAIQTPGGHWRIPHASFMIFMEAFHTPITQAEAGIVAAGKRILIIDDDVSAHELVQGALEIHCTNYEVHSAYDGYSGLIEIGHLQPDLILLDIMMPDINGLEIIHRLKADNTPLPNAKIIAITAASDRQWVVNRIHKADIEAVLFKPLNIGALVDSVQNALGDGEQVFHAGLGI
ncbi:MAG: response regulator [Mariprofundaceae bacterium]|nr:response regulator [Mariprofundaceae bacterium]